MTGIHSTLFSCSKFNNYDTKFTQIISIILSRQVEICVGDDLYQIQVPRVVVGKGRQFL